MLFSLQRQCRAVGRMPVLPYLQFSVEEASSITCLTHWSNLKARLVGRLLQFDPLTGAGRLEAVGEGTVTSIGLSFALVLDAVIDWLTEGILVQVFGELQVLKGKPLVRVHLASLCRGLDCEAYYRAVCRIQSFLPCNVRRH